MTFHLHPDGFLRLAHWRRIPWLHHAFSTRAAGDFSSPHFHDGLVSVGGSDGMSIESVRQVHSDRLHVSENSSPRNRQPPPEADGLLSRQPGRLLSIRTADCLPILLVDPERRNVAAVHAGWRGSAQNIASGAVEAMQREFGSRPADLQAAIGPGIGPCCYEVGPEVAAQFPSSAVVKSGRPHLHLALENRRQLVKAGISSEKVWIADMCTCCQADQFFSYRREGKKAGRMLAVVGIKPDSGDEKSVTEA